MFKLKTLLSYLIQFITSIRIEFAIPVSKAKNRSIIFMPDQPHCFHCGISALVAFKGGIPSSAFDIKDIHDQLALVQKKSLSKKTLCIQTDFLGGDDTLEKLLKSCQTIKQEVFFSTLFFDKSRQKKLSGSVAAIEQFIIDQTRLAAELNPSLPATDVDVISHRIEQLQDICWCLKKEILDNIVSIKNLAIGLSENKNEASLAVFKRINAVLNSIDRLEVRGRDSSGISVLFTFTKNEFENFRESLIKAGLSERLKQRTNHLVLTNNSITISDTHTQNEHLVSISFVYKYAAEIGSLGDNVAFLRSQIKNDLMLQLLTQFNYIGNSVSAHTRWASVGDISVANCHPVDNTPTDHEIEKSGIVHVCLNGDIDNYLELKTEYEARYDKIHEDINTDTKLIPLQIEHYLKLNHPVEEAFRLAVNDFEGSHAISMHTNLCPGKLFLAQKGSGQAIFVGIARDHYIAASELYGIVEETQNYIKLNGEDRGQIVILDQQSTGDVEGIRSFYYDNTPISISPDQLLTSQITSRDIDRQNYPHYFLKEISESPDSVEKTLDNKFKQAGNTHLLATTLDHTVIPASMAEEFKSGKIKKVCFIGQGTAGIAAQGCADLLKYYLGGHDIEVKALKSSELSGFSIAQNGADKNAMANLLVVAISQSRHHDRYQPDR
jgi:glucosamine--fructose-6-phosphate aminotransferase (isomerizing)